MTMIRTKRGLNLPISGAPEQRISEGQRTRSVAIVGCDYVGMKPTMAVVQGDAVKLGQPLFSDKKNPSVVYTSPAAGIVAAINRGHQRRLLSVVIDLDPDSSTEAQVELSRYSTEQLTSLSADIIVQDLLKSGLWTSLRTRPFSRVPDPATRPHSLFINAMDTNPLAALPYVVLESQLEEFKTGVELLSRLAEQQTFVCVDRKVDGMLAGAGFSSKVQVQEFRGPHPSGLPGTHIHYLEPAGVNKQIWHVNYQDVAAIGKLFTSGRLSMDRVISLAGPQVTEPRLVKSRVGANLEELCAAELEPHESRVVSGSVLGGRKAEGAEAYLGRYHLQVSVLREGRERPLMGYLSPGRNRHSIMGIYISSLFKDKRHAMSTSTQGSERAMVPIGAYEKIMPMDILPTQLLRSLIVGDIESAQNLGALELDEEDLALCSYVCPGKYEYGPILRDLLTQIEKEG